MCMISEFLAAARSGFYLTSYLGFLFEISFVFNNCFCGVDFFNILLIVDKIHCRWSVEGRSSTRVGYQGWHL